MAETQGNRFVPGRAVVGLMALVGLTVLVACATASAAPIVVDTVADTNDDPSACTLRDAIDAASTNTDGGGACVAGDPSPTKDTITFSVAGTIFLHSALLNLPGDLEIDGPGAGELTVARAPGAGEFTVFHVPATSEHVIIQDLTASNGRTSLCGAGIFNQGALDLTRVVVSGNHEVNPSGSARGGGVCNIGGLLTIDHSTISGNDVSATAGVANESALGGGIFNPSGGTVNLTDSTVSGNTAYASTTNVANEASAEGGGIYNLGTTVVKRSTISGNYAEAEGPSSAASGGGLLNTDTGSISLTLSTVAGNSAGATSSDGEGGGLSQANPPGGHISLFSSTVAGNAAAEGANVYADVAPVIVPIASDTIVADPIGGANCAAGSLIAPMSSADYNIDSGSSCGLAGGHDRHDLDPKVLFPLAANGGPTLTLALAADSPALDSGDDAQLSDQRGEARPVDLIGTPNLLSSDGTDVGAYELQDTTPPVLRLQKHPPKRTRSRKAIFKFSSNEPGTTFTCKLDRRKPKPCSSPLKLSHMTPGSHHLVVYGVDVWGNSADAPLKASWNVKKNVKA